MNIRQAHESPHTLQDALTNRNLVIVTGAFALLGLTAGHCLRKQATGRANSDSNCTLLRSAINTPYRLEVDQLGVKFGRDQSFTVTISLAQPDMLLDSAITPLSFWLDGFIKQVDQRVKNGVIVGYSYQVTGINTNQVTADITTSSRLPLVEPDKLQAFSALIFQNGPIAGQGISALVNFNDKRSPFTMTIGDINQESK